MAVRLAGTSNVVELSRSHAGLFNGQPLPSLPYEDNQGNTISRTGSSVVIRCPTAGATVTFFVGGAVRVNADRDSTLVRNTNGLCGTFDGDATDEATHVAMLDRWKNSHTEVGSLFASSSCVEGAVIVVGGCTGADRAAAVLFCSRVVDETYIACHDLVDPQPCFQNCVFDHCNDREQACSSFAVHEDMCMSSGVAFDDTTTVV